MMIRKMKISAWFVGGGCIEREITYSGKTLDDIESAIDNDRAELEYWMKTGFDEGSECFNFNGFMLKKKHMAAVELTEADF